MTLTCSNCGVSEFIITHKITKEAEETYSVKETFRCYNCGEMLPMSRKPSSFIGLIRLGEDVK